MIAVEYGGLLKVSKCQLAHCHTMGETEFKSFDVIDLDAEEVIGQVESEKQQHSHQVNPS